MVAQLTPFSVTTAQVVTHMAPGKAVTLVTSRDRLIADKPGDIGQRAQEWLGRLVCRLRPRVIEVLRSKSGHLTVRFSPGVLLRARLAEHA